MGYHDAIGLIYDFYDFWVKHWPCKLLVALNVEVSVTACVVSQLVFKSTW